VTTHPDTATSTESTTPPVGFVATVYSRLRGLFHEAAKFGIVGLSALVVDIGLFNILLYFGPLEGKPLTAKAVSVAMATTVAYFGNRFWTFKHRGRSSFTREYLLFFGLNGVAMLIAMSVLWVSHYGLGLDSPLADNISANVIGLGLGTLFRFWSYRKFVFPEVDDAEERERIMDTAAI
jgi:putative flippase GtrA